MIKKQLVAAPPALFALCAIAVGCGGTDKPHQAPTKQRAQAPAPTASQGTTNRDWWPNQLDLRALKPTAPKGDPTSVGFDYGKAFESLDLAAVKKDIEKVLTTSKDWWPADYGHYGGLMIRLAWHSSGTYRINDGRGGAASGTIRFAPLNSWPDNANLDKARRLLWPVKKKYGRNLSWADLMILAGNVSLESMGFKTFGFGGGRVDVFEPTDINWGPETKWLTDERFADDGSLAHPLAASLMGLIYVNPEGPNGKPDPLAAAERIRLTFGRMGMNDEETVALIAGGHTLGKAHGAARPDKHVGPEPERAELAQQGLGWHNRYGKGNGADTITSGLEGAWTQTPVKWSHGFLKNLYNHEWALTKSPAGAKQWTPKNGTASVPDAHDKSKLHKPMMLTTDLALRMDPKYRAISKRFLENPKEFNAAFAKAWYKLTHRDMGPHTRLRGAEVPPPQRWQDPVPAVKHPLVTASDVKALKRDVLKTGASVPALVRLAWASAATYRDTDKRGGANGARIRLAPQKDWAVNAPAESQNTLATLEKVQRAFNRKSKRKISMADLIVLAGDAAIEKAASDAGQTVQIPFSPGRTDATQEMTDEASFAVLQPAVDGFRNYVTVQDEGAAARALVDHADRLTLSAGEMTALVGGMRALGATHDGSRHGVLTERPGTLDNSFFVNLLDMGTEWKAGAKPGTYEGFARGSSNRRWTATSLDLLFGSNSQLRALSEVYASDDGNKKLAKDFAAAWHKVMHLDRFDLKRRR